MKGFLVKDTAKVKVGKKKNKKEGRKGYCCPAK